MFESNIKIHIFTKINSEFAYIGPRVGSGVIAAIFGIIAAFFSGLWGIL